MKKKIIKVLNAIIDILIVIILIFSLTVVAMSVTAKKNGVSNLFGYTFLGVKTDSMEPTIMVGDLIIGRVTGPESEFEIGDVVTFKKISNNTIIFNSHRIAEKIESGGNIYYRTKGDNSPGLDDEQLSSYDIVALWEGKRIPVLGGVLNYLRSGEGFLIFLLIPIILFFIICAYRFVKNLILYNREKTVEAVKAAAKEAADSKAEIAAAELTEEQKQKIINEFLAKQQTAKDNREENNRE